MAVRMELSRILVAELHDMQVIELSEIGGERTFPILIGLNEAEAIQRRFQHVSLKRPLTHDLLANVIAYMGGELVSVTVSDLSDHTFFATLDIRTEDGEELHVDARPSDAIAVAAGQEVPIFVAEHVLEDAASQMPAQPSDDPPPSSPQDDDA